MTETTLNDLPPCPFCGGKDLGGITGIGCWLYCRDCGAQGPTTHGEQQAMKRWSERHSQKDGQ